MKIDYDGNRIVLKSKDCITAQDLVLKLARFVVADLNFNDRDIFIVVTPDGIKVEKYNSLSKKES